MESPNHQEDNPGKEGLDSIFLPSQDDLEKKDFEFLHQKLQENHRKLLKHLQETEMPYFALHGTSERSANSIMGEKDKRVYLQVATFYEKEKTEAFLYKLYHAAEYVSAYAKNDRVDMGARDNKKTGCVLVFFTEKNGVNTAHKWEHLHPGNSASLCLDWDTEAERKCRKSLEKSENLLHRSDGYFDPQLDLKGTIFFHDFPQLVVEYNLQVPPMESFARSVIKRRYLTQEILSRTFKILAS